MGLNSRLAHLIGPLGKIGSALRSVQSALQGFADGLAREDGKAGRQRSRSECTADNQQRNHQEQQRAMGVVKF